MIHTVLLRSKSSDKAVFNKFQEDKSLRYRYPGITFEEYREGKDEQLAQYKVKAKINLLQTIEPTNYLDTYKGKNTERILDAIGQVFSELELPPLEDWVLARVDFTVDLHTPYVAEYLEILAKGNHKHEPTHTKNGLYIPYSDRGITVNFYNKAEQQRAKYGDEAAEKARDILRLEIECGYDKLTTLFSQFPVARDLRSFLLVNGGSHILEMVRDTVEKELLRIVTNNCDHISQRAALARVSDSKKQANIKKQLAEILREINAEGSSISIAKNSLCGGVEAAERKFRRRIRDFYSLGINPICVPPGLAVKRLESMEQLYLEALIAECNSEK